MKKRWIAAILFSAVGVGITIAGIVLMLIWNGTIMLNYPSEEEYPVRGVDVSSHQGFINWDILASQNVDFAFIKATEGSTHLDSRFAYNFKQATNTAIRIGAYHFFSFDSAGSTQAENYIRNVPKMESMLPPIVDIELYGAHSETPPEPAIVTAELNDLLTRLESHYGKQPILYTNEKVYAQYLQEDYADYDIWICSVYWSPNLPDGKGWTFWQYSTRGIMEGYIGKEKHIDLNVFCGTEAEFAAYGRS